MVVKKINGRAQRITLGRYPGLRLDDARQAARTIAGEIAKGGDPVALRKAARARKTRLSDLWPPYLAHLKQRNRTWRRDKQRWETEVSPAFGKKALAEITRSDCQALIDRIGADRPIAANRVAAFLSALLNFAVRSDRLAVNPAKGLIRFQETSRSRILKSDELENLMKAIEAEARPLGQRLPDVDVHGRPTRERRQHALGRHRSRHGHLDDTGRGREEQNSYPDSDYATGCQPASAAIGALGWRAVGVSEPYRGWPFGRPAKGVGAGAASGKNKKSSYS